MLPWLQSAVQLLNLVQEILPAVAALNCRLSQSSPPSPRHATDHNSTPRSGHASEATPRSGHASDQNAPPRHADQNPQQTPDHVVSSQHHAIVESDHPYKPATVANFVVSRYLDHL